MTNNVFSTVNYKALHNKSAQYIKRAFKLKKEHDMDGYMLFASLSLELLAKASLSKFSEYLIVDHRSSDSLLVASKIESKVNNEGKKVKIKVEDVRTIGAAEAYKKVALIIPKFNKYNENACQNMAKIRNAELHSGASISEMLGKHWEGNYFCACDVILNSYGYNLDQWNEKAESEYISSIVGATIDRLNTVEEKVKESVNKAKAEIEKVSPSELEKRIKKSQKFKLHGKYPERWSLNCPVCGNLARAAGSETFHSIMDFMIAREQGVPTNIRRKEFFPSKFRCVVCELSLDNREEVNATDLFETYIK